MAGVEPYTLRRCRTMACSGPAISDLPIDQVHSGPLKPSVRHLSYKFGTIGVVERLNNMLDIFTFM